MPLYIFGSVIIQRNKKAGGGGGNYKSKPPAVYNGDADNCDSDVKVQKKAKKKAEDRGRLKAIRVAEKEITGETFIWNALLASLLA